MLKALKNKECLQNQSLKKKKRKRQKKINKDFVYNSQNYLLP